MPETTKQHSKEGKIVKVSGPLVVAQGLSDAQMYEVVRVGNAKLIGEAIRIEGPDVYIQVYEETSGIGPGEPVYLSGQPLTVELGPGLIEGIYDGIQRPLKDLVARTGDFVGRGVEARALDSKRKWRFQPSKKNGDNVEAGDILGEVQETVLLSHKIMTPPFLEQGEIVFLAAEGDYTIEDIVARIKSSGKTWDVKMSHKWPIRQPRPVSRKLVPGKGLVTGQRVIDTFFPVAKGGAACVPGPFGSGKTVVQGQICRWGDADVIVFVAAGERGNEVADLLQELPSLSDPKTGRPLMERTILIANTSNMPVAAREASVYTGITIAEYFRDMGYSVALLADSTSRWAEALREISGRLEEMPGDEGYPAYLGSRTAAFYERAGYVECLGGDKREGFLTVIGAVSPPGGDLSEPVTQNTLRVTKVFWALDSALAYKRHFPAINWLNSYSLYSENLKEFFEKQGGEGFNDLREQAMKILQKEAELEEIVRLVGIEALSAKDQFLLEMARVIREDFLHQNAFVETDSYTSLAKQYLMLKTIIQIYHLGTDMAEKGKAVSQILSAGFRQKISQMKHIAEGKWEHFQLLIKEMNEL